MNLPMLGSLAVCSLWCLGFSLSRSAMRRSLSTPDRNAARLLIEQRRFLAWDRVRGNQHVREMPTVSTAA